ncbi:hypothetical protein KO02_18450 [Sphingobacterium sp. ML3W]|uniref:hypothetical protein n=1 Tax=Sphingobacterium sp. ML3W TaxID=1538644 RepID=UPI0004F929CD|nr:hypothetical protein [Sphingobacterium sp. ML3W]AIM38451.1 hypothetical protein KO02_18450 [Sphingobacterium sp. ML3W]
METSYTNDNKNFPRYFKRISWGAVIAGVIVTIIVQLLLTLLGVGIGFVSFTPTSDNTPFSGMGTGLMVWWILTTLISLFAGGWVSGWLSSTTCKVDRILHGVLTWSVFALFSLYLFTTSLGSLVGGIGNVLGKGLSSAGGALKDNLPDVSAMVGDNLGLGHSDLKKLKDEATTLLKQTGKKELQPGNLEKKAENAVGEAKKAGRQIGENPDNADDVSKSLLSKLYNLKDSVMSDVDKDALVNVVAERTGKSKVESEQIVDNWINTAEEAKQKIKELSAEAAEKSKKVGEEVSDALGKAAIFGFFALLVGAASAIGGSLVGRNKTHTHYRQSDIV